MNKYLRLVASLVIGIFILACAGSGGSAPSSGNGDDNSQPAGGQGPAVRNSMHYQLPSSPGVPDDDVLQQVVLSARGGPGGSDCSMNCAGFYGDQSTILLTHFQPDQRITLDIYYPSGITDGGTELYDFLTEFSVQFDESGSLIIYLDGKCAFRILDYETRTLLANS